MVVIQEHKTYFVSSRLHLLHGLGEVESTGTFPHITYINITDSVLLVRYRRNRWSQFVGALIAK